MRVRLLGGAGTVTGSKFLVTHGRTQLLVDCGLYQGAKHLRESNWRPPDLDPQQLAAVVLTHAHIDHTGYLPVLVRDGYRGPVFGTPPTRDLCEILWIDSARLQEEEARYRNRTGTTRHRPARPLYTEDDARAALHGFREVQMGAEWRIGELTLRTHCAGHILGAASLTITDGDTVVLFSGDIGRSADPLMPAPAPPSHAHFVIMESTYGDREHPIEDPCEVLGSLIRRVTARDGILLMSTFAVGRAQLLLHTIDRTFRLGRTPRIPVFLDSPMAADVTDLYRRHPGAHRLGAEECRAIGSGVEFIRTRDASKALNGRSGPFVLLAASGMLAGGRITHHLKRLVGDPKNLIALPGFQAAGTRGADLAAGARSVKVHGERLRVRAEIVPLDQFSAHADRSELLHWLGRLEEPPRRIILVHGEPAAAHSLRGAIRDRFGYAVDAGVLDQVLDTESPGRDRGGPRSGGEPLA